MASIETYIGQGISFPIKMSATGGPVVESGFPLVNSSIKNLLMWPTMNRIFLSEYGSNLNLLIEEPNDYVLTSLVKNFIVNTLNTWEKRIIVQDVAVNKISVDKLVIAITYRLTKSNLEETFVFPFYRNIIY